MRRVLWFVTLLLVLPCLSILGTECAEAALAHTYLQLEFSTNAVDTTRDTTLASGSAENVSGLNLANATLLNGQTVTAAMTFTISRHETENIPPNGLWSEHHDAVAIQSGYVSVLLGTKTDIPPYLFDVYPELWIEIEINDSVYSPRVLIVSDNNVMMVAASTTTATSSNVKLPLDTAIVYSAVSTPARALIGRGKGRGPAVIILGGRFPQPEPVGGLFGNRRGMDRHLAELRSLRMEIERLKAMLPPTKASKP